MTFSDRTPDNLSPNRISQALEKASGRRMIDLTESNPTRCGFDYPKDLLDVLKCPEGLQYDPHPFGQPEARQAIANYLVSKGQKVDPGNIVLTASTSEAYSYLFKLLANPGNSFLIPTPGYPLLEHLARLEGVTLLPYPFQVDPSWPLDKDGLERALEKSCRGLVTVNPNNPTGAFLSLGDNQFLGSFCEKNGLAYISDEVFSEYGYAGHSYRPWTPSQTLSFRLGGLSKSLGLPQLKLSWIILEGPAKPLAECRERLELIADTYLSVNTPVQLGLRDLLKFGPSFQKQLMERVDANRNFLKEKLEGFSQVKPWPAQGGWYALVEMKVPKAREEDWVVALLEKHQVFVQPGGFYDMPSGRFLVLSLLPKPAIFQEGISRIRMFLEAGGNG